MNTPDSFLLQLTSVKVEDIIAAPHDWIIVESGVTAARDGLTGIDGGTTTKNPDAFPGLLLTLTREQIELAQTDGRPLFAYVNVAVTDTNRAYWEAEGVNWIKPTGPGQENLDIGMPTLDAPEWLKSDFGTATGFGPIVDFTNKDWRQIVVDQIIAQLEAGYKGIFLDDVGRYDEVDHLSDGEAGRLMMETVNWVLAEARKVAAERPDLADDFLVIINSDHYIASNFYFSITDSVASGGQGRSLTNEEIALINEFMANVDGILTENVAELRFDPDPDPWQIGRTWFDGNLSNLDPRLQDTSAVLLAVETGDKVENIEAVFEALKDDVLAFLPQDQAYDTYMDVPQIGTPHNDTLVATDRSTALVGLQGNDSLSGGGGNDVAYGGSGSDTISVGAGDDVADAGAGNDIAYAGAGNDTMEGGDGNDTLLGGEDADTLIGGKQEDNLNGEYGHDLMFGNAGFDRMSGGSGNDTMDGGDQADNLFGGAGNDLLFGGNGFDRLFGQDGNDRAYGGNGSDALFGQMGDDSLYGQNDNDRFWGGLGNDYLDGGAGDDVMRGGAGFDTLLGSIGNDTMTGNFNADTFVFTDFGGGFGQDVITDFAATNDFEKISLRGVGSITDFNDLMNGGHIAQIGSDVVIDDLNGNTITLENVMLSDLDSKDFIF